MEIYAGCTHLIDDELKWLIGHEIGHIINHDAELRCLYDIYCDKLKEILSVNTTHTMHLYANATSERELQMQLKPIISTIEYFAKHS